ncbi:MAG TPA: hypothetical protein GX510_04345 [Firmicutes bacterium]|nr:hypothetical protein [Candidatus Fermentithermobacillaceae bacterium]
MGDPAIDENGNGGFARVEWCMMGSARSPSYAQGSLTYALRLVVNNEDLNDYHCVEYYSTSAPKVTWYVEASS